MHPIRRSSLFLTLLALSTALTAAQAAAMPIQPRDQAISPQGRDIGISTDTYSLVVGAGASDGRQSTGIGRRHHSDRSQGGAQDESRPRSAVKPDHPSQQKEGQELRRFEVPHGRPTNGVRRRRRDGHGGAVRQSNEDSPAEEEGTEGAEEDVQPGEIDEHPALEGEKPGGEGAETGSGEMARRMAGPTPSSDKEEESDDMEEGAEEGVEEGAEEGVEDKAELGPVEGVEESSDDVEEGAEEGADEGVEDKAELGPVEGVEEGAEEGADEGADEGAEEGAEEGAYEDV